MPTKKTSESESHYLEKIVKANTFGDDSQEMKDLRSARDRVEATLRKELGDDPHIRYGGSHAKGTMVATSYDLDLPCYFPRDADDAGETLEALWDSVKTALEKDYVVEPKTSAIRLLEKESKKYLHVDVVPGRYVDDAKTDVFLHQNGGDKARLKTNPEKHITHVRDSEVRPAGDQALEDLARPERHQCQDVRARAPRHQDPRRESGRRARRPAPHGVRGVPGPQRYAIRYRPGERQQRPQGDPG